jgi:hypothetical protein
MIDIYATAGTFADVHALARNVAALVKTVEQVPDIPMFRSNTAAFVHEMPAGTLANVDGDGNYVEFRCSQTPARSIARNRLPSSDNSLISSLRRRTILG